MFKKCPYSKFFWPIFFFRIRTDYGDLQSKMMIETDEDGALLAY